MSLDELVVSVRKTINKPKGFKVFYASGLNICDVRTTWRNLNEEERALALQLFNESFSESVHEYMEADEDKLIAFFNALYDTTSNLSHIANAMNNDVLAVLHDRPIEDGNIKIVRGKNDGNISVDLPHHVNRDVNIISGGTFWGKNRKHCIYGNPHSYSPVELLTVFSIEGGQEKTLVKNFPVMANYSFIISAEGKLIRQKYGEHNKFIDVNGKNHLVY